MERCLYPHGLKEAMAVRGFSARLSGQLSGVYVGDTHVYVI